MYLEYLTPLAPVNKHVKVAKLKVTESQKTEEERRLQAHCGVKVSCHSSYSRSCVSEEVNSLKA
jgi:hypothetical protein